MTAAINATDLGSALRKIIAEARAQIGDGVVSEAGLMLVAERAFHAGAKHEREFPLKDLPFEAQSR